MVTVTKIIPTKKTDSYNIYLNNKYSFTVSDLVLATFKLKAGITIDKNSLGQILSLELTERLKNYSLSVLSSRPKSEEEILKKLEERILKYKESWPIFNNRVTKFQKKFNNISPAKNEKIGCGGNFRILNLNKNSKLNSSINPQIVSLNIQRNVCLEDTVAENIFTTSKNNTIKFLKKYNYVNNVDFANWLVSQRVRQGKGKLFIKQDLLKKGVSFETISNALKKIDTKESIKHVYKKALKKYAKENDKYKQKQKIYKYLLSKGFSYDEINLNTNFRNHGI